MLVSACSPAQHCSVFYQSGRARAAQRPAYGRGKPLPRHTFKTVRPGQGYD